MHFHHAAVDPRLDIHELTPTGRQTHCRLQTADCRLTDCWLLIAGWGAVSDRPTTPICNHQLPASDHRWRADGIVVTATERARALGILLSAPAWAVPRASGRGPRDGRAGGSENRRSVTFPPLMLQPATRARRSRLLHGPALSRAATSEIPGQVASRLGPVTHGRPTRRP